jgi:hypothetical protein
MLTKFDELTCHQIVSTFDHPETSDRSFTEKLWFNIHDTRGQVVVAAGLGIYPNRNVLDGYGCVGVPGRQHNLRLSRELRPRLDELAVGPLALEVIEPFRRWHLALDAKTNPQGFGFDLEFLAGYPPGEEKPQFGRVSGRTIVNTCRYSQMGRARGVIRLPDGRSIELKPDGTVAQRDHSWGLRMGVGQPESGVQEMDVSSFMGMMINWCVAQFGDWGLHYYLIEKDDGRVQHQTGAILPSLECPGPAVPIEKVEHDFVYHPGSLRMQSGRVILHAADGRKLEVHLKELCTMYLRGGGYIGYKDFRHGSWMGADWSDGETWDLGQAGLLDEVHGLNDTVCEYRCGDQVGHGIMENLILPPFPRYL